MLHRKRNRALTLAVLALGFCGASPALAAVTPGGDTTVAASSAQDTIVGSTGIGTLGVDGGSVLTNVGGHIGRNAGSSGTAMVNGAGSKWVNSSLLVVGSAGNGSLTIDSGGQVTSKNGFIGFGSDSTGIATIRGADSAWSDSGELFIGFFGSARLSIEDAGQVSSSGIAYLGYRIGSTATATVTGQGSTWNSQAFWIGNFGSGTLTIDSGGQVGSTNSILGYNSGASGAATVSGAGSKWTSGGDLIVGYSGSGMLTVTDGGQVAAQTLFASLGDLHGDGTITVNGAVLDADLVFDSTHGLAKTFAFGSGGTLAVTFDGGHLGVGHKGTGSLIVTDGIDVRSASGFLGYNSGSSGTAVISGAGSRWINSSYLAVGSAGSGMLTIEGGGQVTNATGYVGHDSGSNGTVTVSGAGSRWTSSGELTVGASGSGTLIIEGGGQVGNTSGTVAGNTAGNIGSTGAVTVSGVGSTWANSASLAVGGSGNGTLTIESGGQVSSSRGLLGGFVDSTGTVIVSGPGSKWAINNDLTVGLNGSGTLSVTDGGLVTAKTMSIKSQSAIRLHVSGNNMLMVGNATTNGTLTNNGTIGFYAEPSLPAGTYRPISAYPFRAMTWSGAGSYEALGGTWDNTAKTFTVTMPTALSAGDTDAITTGERLLFTDTTGQKVGASFGTVPADTTFSAAPMAAADLAPLASLLGEYNELLAAWTFTTNFTASEALLSFDIGPEAEGLAVWHLNDGVWSAYTPSLFTHDSHGLASFTVNSFSGYAISAAVPEPASATLLALATTLLLTRRQRKS